jgi:hypothetical protein
MIGPVIPQRPDTNATRRLSDVREVVALDLSPALADLLGSRLGSGPAGLILGVRSGPQAVVTALMRALSVEVGR